MCIGCLLKKCVWAVKICNTVTHTFEGMFSEGRHKLPICTNLSSNHLRVTAVVLS